MSNGTFLAVVGAIIIAIVASLAVQKFDDCMQHGGKACPKTRVHIPDPQSRIVVSH